MKTTFLTRHSRGPNSIGYVYVDAFCCLCEYKLMPFRFATTAVLKLYSPKV